MTNSKAKKKKKTQSTNFTKNKQLDPLKNFKQNNFFHTLMHT